MPSGQSEELEVYSEWGELEEQDGAIFEDCQSLINEALIQEVGMPMEERQESVSGCRKHDSKILFPRRTA